MANSAVTSCPFNGVPVLSWDPSEYLNLYCALSFFIVHTGFLSVLLLLSKASLTHAKSDKRGKKRHNCLNIKFNSTCHSAQWLDCEI